MSVFLTFISGSSPHVRGAQLRGPAARQEPGIIPACAGSTANPRSTASCPWDHPRMCGEHLTLAGMKVIVQGSSPHVRGALTCGVAR